MHEFDGFLLKNCHGFLSRPRKYWLGGNDTAVS